MLKRKIVSISPKKMALLLAMIVALPVIFYLAKEDYFEGLVPSSTDLCSPDATRIVLDTAAATWPTDMNRDDYCRKQSEGE